VEIKRAKILARGVKMTNMRYEIKYASLVDFKSCMIIIDLFSPFAWFLYTVVALIMISNHVIHFITIIPHPKCLEE